MGATFCAAAVLARQGLVFDNFQGAADPERDRLVAVTDIRKDDTLNLLSRCITVTPADGTKTVEKVRRK